MVWNTEKTVFLFFIFCPLICDFFESRGNQNSVKAMDYHRGDAKTPRIHKFRTFFCQQSAQLEFYCCFGATNEKQNRKKNGKRPKKLCYVQCSLIMSLDDYSKLLYRTPIEKEKSFSALLCADFRFSSYLFLLVRFSSVVSNFVGRPTKPQIRSYIFAEKSWEIL